MSALTLPIPPIIITYVLVLIRTSAMIMALPVLGSKLVTSKIKVMLSLAISFTIFMTITDQSLAVEHSDTVTLILLVAAQFVIGLIYGFVVNLVFQAFAVAGQLAAMQIGLGFAQLVDPQSEISVPAVSQFYMLIATLIYLTMNGHLYIIKALVSSFKLVPIYTFNFGEIDFQLLANLGVVMFSYGLKIALPIIVTLLITNSIFGIMTKSAPQINIFTIGFSISLIVGIVCVWILIPYLPDIFFEITDYIHGEIPRIIHASLNVGLKE